MKKTGILENCRNENKSDKPQFDGQMVYLLREAVGFPYSKISKILKISEVEVEEKFEAFKDLKSNNHSPSAGQLFDFNLIYCNAMTERVMNEIKKIN